MRLKLTFFKYRLIILIKYTEVTSVVLPNQNLLIMKKTLLILFIFTSSVVLAQKEIVGFNAVGVNINAGWGGLSGFRGQIEGSFGKFVKPNLKIGVNAQFGSSGNGNKIAQRYSRLYPDGSLEPFFSAYDKDFTLGANIFANYYLTQNTKIQPFIVGELGFQNFTRKYSRIAGEPINTNSKLFPNATIGLGAKIPLNKSKSFNLEVQYSISNPKYFTISDFGTATTRIDKTTGNLRLGVHYQFGKKKK